MSWFVIALLVTLALAIGFVVAGLSPLRRRGARPFNPVRREEFSRTLDGLPLQDFERQHLLAVLEKEQHLLEISRAGD